MSLFFHNGVILTQLPDRPLVQAVAVRNGVITEIGDHLKPAPDAIKIDLRGQTLIPGFNDAHIHIWKVGDLLTHMLDLRGVGSMSEMQDRLADFARANPQNEWILARGFNEALFPDGAMPSRLDLDKVISDKPVHVIRTCAHIAVLNTKALNICGIGKNTPVPSGGEIRLDANGEPNGVITETALGLPKKHMPVYTAAAYRRMILAAQDALLQAGVSAATDPAVHPELLDVYKSMDSAGELRIRINAVPIRVPDGDAQALPLPEPYQSDFLTVNTVKFFSDGGISGQTAALKYPYRGGDNKGVLRLDADFFYKLALESQTAGFKIAVHAIGDAAMERVIGVFERIDRYNTQGIRHRIEHAGLPEYTHLKSMSELGLWAVSQPVFVYELGQNFRRYLPQTYLDRIYPYRTMMEAGVDLAFSSDAPVVKNFNPLMGIRNAVERCDLAGVAIAPSEAIGTEPALYAYTAAAAAANDATQIGQIAPGKWADFTILERNLTEVSVEQISDIQVSGVYIAGKPIKQME